MFGIGFGLNDRWGVAMSACEYEAAGTRRRLLNGRSTSGRLTGPRSAKMPSSK